MQIWVAHIIVMKTNPDLSTCPGVGYLLLDDEAAYQAFQSGLHLGAHQAVH